MFKKEIVTKENYKEIVARRGIIACWIILIICTALKLGCGMVFEIAVKDPAFIKVCEFVDKYYISLIIQFVSFMFSSFCIIKSVNFKFSKTRALIISIMLVLYWIFKTLIVLGVFSINTTLYAVLDFIVLYGLCLITYTKKDFTFKGLLKPLIFVALLFIFSILSAITKNIGYHGSINESFLVGFIFMIDYYIMILLTYFYRKRRYLRWVTGDGFRG